MREKILAHPIRWLIGLCACLVFFGCFGFPIYNFTTGRQFGSWYLLLALCFFYYEIGQILEQTHEGASNQLYERLSAYFETLRRLHYIQFH